MTSFKRTVWEKTLGLVTTAFGLVAGLAWNEAITDLIARLFPVERGALLAKFIYAAGVTGLAVLVTIYLAKFSARAEN